LCLGDALVPIVRTNKTKDFTIISNIVFRDERLSLKAKGIYCIICSLPDNWDLSLKGLEKITGEGSKSLRAGIKELEDSGYMKMKRFNTKGVVETVWTFYESPETPINTVSSENVNVQNVNVQNVNVQNVSLQNGNQLSTKDIKNLNNKELKKQRTKESDVLFIQFYDLYPKKQGKQSAIKAFEKALKQTTHENILAGLRNYKAQIASKNTEMQYIKQPATWLNAGCWEDDYGSTTTTTSSTNAYDALLARIKSVMDHDGNFEHNASPCNIHNIEKFISADENGIKVYYTDVRGYTNPKYFTIEAITKIGAYC
jgi:hypothetical protein